MVLAIVIFALAILSAWVIVQWRDMREREFEVQPTNEVQPTHELNVENSKTELEKQTDKKVLLRWVATALPSK